MQHKYVDEQELQHTSICYSGPKVHLPL